MIIYTEEVITWGTLCFDKQSFRNSFLLMLHSVSKYLWERQTATGRSAIEQHYFILCPCFKDFYTGISQRFKEHSCRDAIFYIQVDDPRYKEDMEMRSRLHPPALQYPARLL